jgi:hypothetical protein
MAGARTRFAIMIQQGDVNRVEEMIANYEQTVSSLVSSSAKQSIVKGTVLHISKSKTVAMTTKLATKTSRREVSYFRMVFCRLVAFV